jgi:hypothetical protein
MKALAVVIAILVSGCTHVRERTSAELLIGSKVAEAGFKGSGPMFTGTVRYRVSERVLCSYQHISFVTKGEPFTAKSDEDALDAVSCGVSFGVAHE